MERFSDMLRPGSLICDAGCGHIGKYLVDKVHKVVGIDISQRCVDIATSYNTQIDFKVRDMMNTAFMNDSLDGIISFYSIIYAHRKFADNIFAEFNRILKSNGKLLIAVKKEIHERIINDAWYESNKVYFTHFIESEVRDYLNQSNFTVDFFDTGKRMILNWMLNAFMQLGPRKNKHRLLKS